VNVHFKLHSTEGATVYDAAYSVNLDFETFFEHVTKSNMSLFLLQIAFARGRHR